MDDFPDLPDAATSSGTENSDLPLHTPKGFLKDVQERKLKEVEGLMLLPEAREDGPWTMLLNYMVPEAQHRFTDAIRERSDEGYLGVIADVKRSSRGADGKPEELLPGGVGVTAMAAGAISAGADAVMMSADQYWHSGRASDIQRLTQLLTGPDVTASSSAVPVLGKDFIVHPLQIAQLVDAGACAVLLVASLLGPDLELMLNTCTVLGIEGVVEVHTTDETLLAIESGATAIMVNRRSRATCEVQADLAVALGALIPGHVLSLACGDLGRRDESEHEMEELQEAGFDGIVLGRALTTGGDEPKRLIRAVKANRLEQRAISWGRTTNSGGSIV